MNKKDTTIWLIAGHHRMGIWPKIHKKDTGAIPHYSKNVTFNPPVFNEHHECEKMVTQAYGILKQEGYTVWACPFTYDLPTKIKWANKVGKSSDLLIEVHMDSFAETSTGGTVYYLTESDLAKHWAEKMAVTLAMSTGLQNRGAKGDTTNRHGRLAIVRDTKPLAFLLEMGFISNPEDMRRVREFGAQAIVDTIKSNF